MGISKFIISTIYEEIISDPLLKEFDKIIKDIFLFIITIKLYSLMNIYVQH